MSRSSSEPVNHQELKKLPLDELHRELGGRMVPFAGFEMPVQYKDGIISEHRHTREKAGLFDVSHMGQAVLSGQEHEITAGALEKLVPGAIRTLKPGKLRYTLLLNREGGIIDDFMVTRPPRNEDQGSLLLVVNAARKQADFEHIQKEIDGGIELIPSSDRALLALQGPLSSTIMQTICPEAVKLSFMSALHTEIENAACIVSRAGYTGEDGFEISVDADDADGLARRLLSHPDVEPIGLGARDTLRLEAGLCLYGHDIDEETSPVEADLGWTVGKNRRETNNFPGYQRIIGEFENGPSRKRIGIAVEGRSIAREGVEILSSDESIIGRVTSGGFGPTCDGSIAMGYVISEFARDGTDVKLQIRNRIVNGVVTRLPFVPHRFYRN